MSYTIHALIERIVQGLALEPAPDVLGCRAARLDDDQLIVFAVVPSTQRLLVAAQIGHARPGHRHSALAMALLTNSALSALAHAHWTFEREALGWCLRRLLQLGGDDSHVVDAVGAVLGQAREARREWRRIGLLIE